MPDKVIPAVINVLIFNHLELLFMCPKVVRFVFVSVCGFVFLIKFLVSIGYTKVIHIYQGLKKKKKIL